jgi:hypothetical protein
MLDEQTKQTTKKKDGVGARPALATGGSLPRCPITLRRWRSGRASLAAARWWCWCDLGGGSSVGVRCRWTRVDGGGGSQEKSLSWIWLGPVSATPTPTSVVGFSGSTDEGSPSHPCGLASGRKPQILGIRWRRCLCIFLLVGASS